MGSYWAVKAWRSGFFRATVPQTLEVDYSVAVMGPSPVPMASVPKHSIQRKISMLDRGVRKGFMPLEEYTAKRSFEKTPEPAPSRKKSSKFPPNYFCVQRHDATRLHYDFRLEVGGVLKSWAVPKGPTLDPAVKHLAAHVEDHPIEYGDFEGNIPAGNYGAGSVMLWDSGTYELLGDVSDNQQLARGDFKFRLNGQKLKGEFALVLMKGRGKGNEWLIIKKRDEFATPGWDVEAHAYSVLSGRTQQEIAQNLPARKAKRKSAGASDRVWASSRPAKRAAATGEKKRSPAPPKKKVHRSTLQA